MAAVTICIDFGAPQNKVCHSFHCFTIFCHEVVGLDAMILVFWMLSFKPASSLSSFTSIKRLFSSSLLSSIRVVSYCTTIKAVSLLEGFINIFYNTVAESAREFIYQLLLWSLNKLFKFYGVSTLFTLSLMWILSVNIKNISTDTITGFLCWRHETNYQILLKLPTENNRKKWRTGTKKFEERKFAYSIRDKGEMYHFQPWLVRCT